MNHGSLLGTHTSVGAYGECIAHTPHFAKLTFEQFGGDHLLCVCAVEFATRRDSIAHVLRVFSGQHLLPERSWCKQRSVDARDARGTVCD